MLWSLLKIVIFVALVAALTLGAGALMESQGGIQVTAGGTEFTLGPLQSVIAAMLVILGVWIFLKLFSLLIALIKFINGDETAFSRYFDRNRERKGYQALSEGLMALASGEGRLAIAKAEKAKKFLERPDLTDLVVAQAAEMTGDSAKAEKVYKRLVQNEQTRFVGVRGLMKQKLAAGETDVALKLAEKAFAIKPRHEEVQDTLLQLQTGASDWQGARATLNAKLKHGSLPRDVHKRRDAVLALSKAKSVIGDDSATIEARETAIDAAKKSPDLVPAVAMAAQAYIETGQPKLAVRVLKKAWSVRPHPDLAAAFAAIEPEETPEARLKRFVTLTKLQPDHPETQQLLAELNLAAEDFPAARRALGDLPETAPDARILTIMAAIERGEGAPENVVRGWLAKALTAPRGPQWVCDNCNHIHAQWEPMCQNCGAFDTLSWTTPPQSDFALPGGAEMLPLLVGPAETPATEIEEAEPVVVVNPETGPVSSGDTAADAPSPEAEVLDAEPVKREA